VEGLISMALSQFGFYREGYAKRVACWRILCEHPPQKLQSECADMKGHWHVWVKILGGFLILVWLPLLVIGIAAIARLIWKKVANRTA
jgi:hypothetical protein